MAKPYVGLNAKKLAECKKRTKKELIPYVTSEWYNIPIIVVKCSRRDACTTAENTQSEVTPYITRECDLD